MWGDAGENKRLLNPMRDRRENRQTRTGKINHWVHFCLACSLEAGRVN